MKIFRVPIIIFFCLIVATSLLGAELYNWTDENGVQHFSNQRPENQKNITVIQGVPESTSPAAPAEKVTPVDTDTEKAETQTQAQPEAPKAAETDNKIRPEDIDRYLGPCYVRYIKRKPPNGMFITTNANWVYQIAEPQRVLVVEQWKVGDQLKICRERGLIFNMTRDTSVAIEAVRVRKGKS